MNTKMTLTFFIHLVICSSHSFGFTLCNIALVTALATISFMKLHVGLKPMRLTSKNINVNILKNLHSKINEFLQLNSGNYSRESNKRVNTDHFTLQNPTSTRPYWIPTRSVSSEARSAEATEIF